LLTVPSCFFFSSRRRHTRFSRDWSSDVCSSDLTNRGSLLRLGISSLELPKDLRLAQHHGVQATGDAHHVTHRFFAPQHIAAGGRSEERRVGKECRSGRWAGHEKKNEAEQEGPM